MNQATHKVKRLFKRMTVREQLLVLLFVIVMLAIWIGSLIGRSDRWNVQRKATAASLQEQQLWIHNADAYASSAAQAKERLEPSRTYTGPQLARQIEDLLQQAKLAGKYDLNPIKSVTGEIYSEHNIRVQLKRIAIADIVKFNELLRRETPYINQRSLRINSQTGKEELLNARYEISSIELAL